MDAPELRRLDRRDFPLLAHWLRAPHVARWWNHETSVEAIERDFGPALDGDDPTEILVALHDGRPFGLVQRYAFADNPGYELEVASLLAVPAGALSMDYFVGAAGRLRRGLGTAMVRESVRTAWFAHPDATAFIVPVVAANIASWRTLERAGFQRVLEGPLRPDNPIDDSAHFFYRVDRPGLAR